jgi:hypothetical protein
LFGVSIPAHLKVLYDELYEACWTGDNGTIQELCLPKHLAEDKEPIQISVLTSTAHNYNGQLTGMLWSISSAEAKWSDASVTGWTPFLVALHRRHWKTARLVIAIATAQYQASDPDAETAPFDPSCDVISDGKNYPHITTFSLDCPLAVQTTRRRDFMTRTRKRRTTTSRKKLT